MITDFSASSFYTALCFNSTINNNIDLVIWSPSSCGHGFAKLFCQMSISNLFKCSIVSVSNHYVNLYTPVHKKLFSPQNVKKHYCTLHLKYGIYQHSQPIRLHIWPAPCDKYLSNRLHHWKLKYSFQSNETSFSLNMYKNCPSWS